MASNVGNSTLTKRKNVTVVVEEPNKVDSMKSSEVSQKWPENCGRCCTKKPPWLTRGVCFMVSFAMTISVVILALLVSSEMKKRENEQEDMFKRISLAYKSALSTQVARHAQNLETMAAFVRRYDSKYYLEEPFRSLFQDLALELKSQMPGVVSYGVDVALNGLEEHSEFVNISSKIWQDYFGVSQEVFPFQGYNGTHVLPRDSNRTGQSVVVAQRAPFPTNSSRKAINLLHSEVRDLELVFNESIATGKVRASRRVNLTTNGEKYGSCLYVSASPVVGEATRAAQHGQTPVCVFGFFGFQTLLYSTVHYVDWSLEASGSLTSLTDISAAAKYTALYLYERLEDGNLLYLHGYDVSSNSDIPEQKAKPQDVLFDTSMAYLCTSMELKIGGQEWVMAIHGLPGLGSQDLILSITIGLVIVLFFALASGFYVLRRRTKYYQQLTISRIHRESQNRLMSYMCHELRNPLHSLLSLVSELSSGDETHDSLVEQIKAICSHMSYLVNDFLDFSKAQLTELKLVNMPTNVSDLGRDCYNQYRTLCVNTTVELELVVDPELAKKFFELDPQRIRQVLSNGMSNAVKVCTDGKVSLAILLDTTRPERRIVFRITDMGNGLGRNDPEELFREYTQMDNAKTAPGTGLGLGISRHIMRLMGGDCTLYNRKDGIRGACFEAWIPYSEPVKTILGTLENPERQFADALSFVMPGSRKATDSCLQVGIDRNISEEDTAAIIAVCKKLPFCNTQVCDAEDMVGSESVHILLAPLSVSLPTSQTIFYVAIAPMTALENPQSASATGYDAVFPTSPNLENCKLEALLQSFWDKIEKRVIRTKKLRIVAAEDDAVVHHILCKTVAKLFHPQSVVYYDGIDVIQHITSGKFQPDCILLDIVMKFSRGDEILVRLRKEFKLSIPIFAVTGNSTAVDIASYKEIGFDEVITKPYTAKSLEKTVARVMLNAE